ncbi:MAG: dUTP diphosphatase [Gammaproteobacteria bacterium]|nr:dUTP diphosphatase [Gammaproteobacteria bacterium]
MTDFSAEQLRQWLKTMVQLQRSHNEKVHPQWDEQGYPFTRAIWIECAELMDHFGWKWWKHQDADLDQVKLELVDIWHFGLSALMIQHGDQVVDVIAKEISYANAAHEQWEFREAVEVLTRKALQGDFSIFAFTATMRALPMSFEDLYSIYVAKNVLNVFRQKNGYKEGTYVKSWAGREDNEHLAELAQSLNIDSSTYIADLQHLLAMRYEQVRDESR